MKALSVKQPWAWAIAFGRKDIENRTWKTSYRGPIAIHASGNLDTQANYGRIAELAGVEVGHVVAMREARSRIVAVANLADICPGSPCECGPWAIDGQHHWKLTGVRQLGTYVPVPGALGLWEVPADVAVQVLDQLPGFASAAYAGKA